MRRGCGFHPSDKDQSLGTPAGGDRAQRADGAEADRAAQAAALSDHQHGGAVGATRAEDTAAADRAR